MALGGSVRKGEKGVTVVYANRLVRTDTSADGDDVERSVSFLKAYTVFNVEQTEDLPAHVHGFAPATLDPTQRIAQAETFFGALHADIRHGGDMAWYSLVEDRVQMPPSKSSRTRRATTRPWRTN